MLQNKNTEISGLAAWAMGEVNFHPALPFLEELRNNKAQLRIYIDGHFYQKSVGQWAQEAIAKLATTG